MATHTTNDNDHSKNAHMNTFDNEKQESESNLGDEEDDTAHFDLSDLFTNNNYEKSTFVIPCYCYYPPYEIDTDTTETNNDGRNEEKQIDKISITIKHSKSASTDYDLTGQIIWPVSFLLSYYLASYHGQNLIKDKNVIELGAGCGVPGIVASTFANTVVLTDGNDIVVEKLLQPNVTLCNDINGALSCQKLVWGNTNDISNLLSKIQNVDVILAADVVQWPAVIEPLLHTMKKILSTSKSKQNPMCILGIVARSNSTYNLFFNEAKRMGFVNIAKVEYGDFLKDGVIPIECREDYRGDDCSAEIYTLELQMNDVDQNSDDGIKIDDEDDLIIGKGYQYTCSLPC